MKKIDVQFIVPEYVDVYDIASMLHKMIRKWALVDENGDYKRIKEIETVVNSDIIIMRGEDYKELPDTLRSKK